MGMEFELKYAADRDVLAEIANALASQPVRYDMETTYYDTPDLTLSARRYTLRRRMENGRSVCTVKTPVGQNLRGEWEAAAGSIEAAIPQLCAMGAPGDLADLTAARVVPICFARFTRLAYAVTFGKSQLEVALDQGILSGGGKELPLSELEIELKSGKPEDAVRYGQLLATRYGLHTERRSKFRRALSLYKGEI